MIESEVKKWNDLVDRWLHYLPPCRPDDEDLATIRVGATIGTRRGGPHVLILGSTPEFRDLALTLDPARVVVVDQNPRMIQAMQQLQRSPNPAEVQVVADWFDFLPQNPRSFDIVLSDLTQGNIPYDERSTFYSRVSASMRVGGLFFDRVFRYDHLSRLYSIEEIRSAHAQLAEHNSRDLNRLLFRLLASEPVRHEVHRPAEQLYEELLEGHPSTSLRHQVEDLRHLMAPDSVLWRYGRDWEMVRTAYTPHLSMIGEHRHNDHVPPRSPLAKHMDYNRRYW